MRPVVLVVLLVSAAEANLLRNPGFEEGALEGWKTFGQNWRQSSFVNDEVSDYRTGRSGVVCDVATNDVNEWRGIQQTVPARKGLRYSAGAWVRTDGIEGSETYLEIRFLDSEGELIEQHQSGHVAADQPFTEMILDDIVAPSGTVYASVGAVIRMRHRPAAWTGFFVFDDFEFDVVQRVNRGPSRPRKLPRPEPAPGP